MVRYRPSPSAPPPRKPTPFSKPPISTQAARIQAKLSAISKAQSIESKSSSYLFISRPGDTPFVFNKSGPLTPSNQEWLISGRIDLGEYEREVEEVEERGEMVIASANREFLRMWEVSTSSSNRGDSPVPMSPPLRAQVKAEIIDLTMEEEEEEEQGGLRSKRSSTAVSTVTGFSTERKPPLKRRMNGKWTAAQDRAMLEAQLSNGEGRNWKAVTEQVNRVSTEVNRKTSKECQDHWRTLKGQIQRFVS